MKNARYMFRDQNVAIIKFFFVMLSNNYVNILGIFLVKILISSVAKESPTCSKNNLSAVNKIYRIVQHPRIAMCGE